MMKRVGLFAVLAAAGFAFGETVTAEGPWEMEQASKPGAWLPAKVPGTVLQTLVLNGVVPDPYQGLNNKLEEKRIPDLSGNREFYTATYRTKVEIPASFAGKTVWIRPEGINYRGEIFLNGRLAAVTAGMFARTPVDVTSFVKPGVANDLVVRVKPVDHPGSPKQKKWGAPGEWHNGGDGEIGRNVTMLMSAGWDFTFNDGIRDRNTGIWRPVVFFATGPVKLDAPCVRTTLNDDLSEATLDLSVEVKNCCLKDGSVEGEVEVEVEGTPIRLKQAFDLRTGLAREVHFTAKVKNPRLWWPKNKGPQNLYKAVFRAKAGTYDAWYVDVENVKKVSPYEDGDEVSCRFGIREAYSDQSGPGGARQFYVNRRKVFVRGTNWIPEAMLKADDARMEREVRLTAESGVNMVRLWAGGIAESDRFYELCDDYGLLVWQEFFLTGDTRQPDDSAIYFGNLTDTIKRIRHHPSLVHYVASNESTEVLGTEALVKALTGTRSYMMTSECDGVHDGSPYFTVNPMRYYADTASPRGSRVYGFNPEFGTCALPCYEQILTFMPENLLWPMEGNEKNWNYREGGGFDQLTKYHDLAVRAYGEPKSLEEYARKSQAADAMSHRCLWETWNLARTRATGVLFWYNNTPIPQLGSHAWDYDLNQEAAFFAQRNALEPLHAQFEYLSNRVSVVSDIIETKVLTVKAEVYDFDSRKVWEKEAKVEVEGEGCVEAFGIPFGSELVFDKPHFIKLRLFEQGGEIASTFYWRSNSVYSDEKREEAVGPCAGGFEELANLPRTTLKVERTAKGVTVTNTGDKLAFFVRLKATRDGKLVVPVHYSDNYLNLLPGEAAEVGIEGLPEGSEINVSAWNARIPAAGLQDRIDALAAQGGGTLTLAPGEYRTGALFFKPGVNLHLEKGARLVGVDEAEGYPMRETRIEGETCFYYPALINAEGCDGFRISGEGEIDGHGLPTWTAFWSMMDAAKAAGRPWVNKAPGLVRPRLLYVTDSKDVDVSGVTFRNSKFWTTHYHRCANLRIHDCTIVAEEIGGVKGPSTDAIDLDVVKGVVISNVVMDVNDDAVVLKGGKGPWADDFARFPGNGPNEDVLVVDCTFKKSCHSVLTLGSESIRCSNVRMENCRVDGKGSLLHLKFRPDTPQVFEGISISGVCGRVSTLLYVAPVRQFFDPRARCRKDLPHGIARNVSLKDVQVAFDKEYAVELNDNYVLEGFTRDGRTLSPDEIKDVEVQASRSALAAAAASFASDLDVVRTLGRPFLPPGAEGSSWASVYQQLDELDTQADRAWLQLKTREDYDARRKAMHAKMIEAMGGFPERTALNARTVATIRREGYVIEKVLFESMPGLLVSANLFVPDRPEFKPPYPAVVMSCGHAEKEGKDSATYQRACVHVANRGMAAFMFDPYEQGERRQYCGINGNCCQQHNLIGLKAMLLGWSMPMLRLWDGMRAVDYVESRAEVDRDRIGYMGQSGGGTMSALMTAADWRLKATAPSCYLTSLGYLCKFMGPQDAEQNIFGQLTFGLNHTGYVLLPDTKVCVTGRYSDMFPWGGAAQLYRTVEDVAAMLGERGNYGLNFAPGPHGWTESTMAASADWMAAWLKGEKELLPLDMPKYRAMDIGYSTKTVDCGIPFGESSVTPDYCTTKVGGSRDIHAILRDRLSAAQAKRVRRTSAETAALVKRLAVVRMPSETKAVVKEVSSAVTNGVAVSRLAFMYPDGLALPAVLLEPEGADAEKPPVLLVGSSGRGLLADDVARGLARGERLLVADVTGTGEIGKGLHAFYGATDTPEEGTAVMLYLMGESLVGRRASDILLLSNWLRQRFGRLARLVAKGPVSIAAAHAFAADRAQFFDIEVLEPPSSWTEIIEKSGAPLVNRYAWCVNGALLEYDWIDLLKLSP